MSDTEQNKSEQATAYKLEQARKKGMVPRSQELGMVLSLLASTGYLSVWGGEMAARLSSLSARALSEAAALGASGGAMLVVAGTLLSQAAHVLAPLITIAMGSALLSAVMQTGFLFASGALKLDTSKLNPLQGFKRVFSMQTLIEAAKACFKMVVYVAIIRFTIVDAAVSLAHEDLSALRIAQTLLMSGIHLLFLLLAAASVFALIDQVLVRHAFAKKMRMSRYEQKQEMKQREGDPRIKQRRRQLQRELLQRSRSMKAVRSADVLVANPTHYAVGLKYDPSRMAAPHVVAKGAGDFALRLKKLAFVYGVPVIESPRFARALYFKAALDREVPGDLYRDTAAIYLQARRAPSQAVSA
ncbi:EscU/YscU/HrcU family type III secretion system export apparatus switch protein [Paraburkholderia sp. UYCP14C]|uniref:EscU/YscU/HrcU family type III secretion system export apparatus switch protein n=1 Tax=Paraburkholderia sp. UYCP14C TaxID=2511130 RepID=UPI001021408B|nr:EscU/YscU/HrcU family type III secretion system export apparatus switch protein [Paraburkholderia sp. UYCP14C]RZF29094.1 EscU/YscU/HrcU family type III secretion system export apparatus switch protein [Paraburkholderia sp. UYCP14C]